MNTDRNGISIGGIIYIIIGVIVASNRGYFTDIGTISHLLSAFLAVVLWPLVLLGVNLHLVL
jgi:ABC-type anion transport system duplicated permease subunit